MNSVDIIIGVIALMGAWSGYRKGFVLTFFGLLALMVGAYGGIMLMDKAMIWLGHFFEINKTILPYLAFGVVFIGVVILVKFIGTRIKDSLDKRIFGTIDNMLGALTGAFKNLFYLSIIIWILSSLQWFPLDEWGKDSRFFKFSSQLAPSVAVWASNWFPSLREIFST